MAPYSKSFYCHFKPLTNKNYDKPNSLYFWWCKMSVEYVNLHRHISSVLFGFSQFFCEGVK